MNAGEAGSGARKYSLLVRIMIEVDRNGCSARRLAQGPDAFPDSWTTRRSTFYGRPCCIVMMTFHDATFHLEPGNRIIGMYAPSYSRIDLPLTRVRHEACARLVHFAPRKHVDILHPGP